MVLMVDTDMIWFNKQRGLEWVPYIEHDLDRLDSLLYMY
jgi:hypothetical protein